MTDESPSIAGLVAPGDPVAILDIGAAPVDSEPYFRLIDAGAGRLLAFEPDPEARARLAERAGPNSRIFGDFVGNGQDAVYYRTNWPPTGSLFEPNSSLLRRFHQLDEVTTLVAKEAVRTRRLDEIREIDDVDFLKIDVQGSELSVFEHGRRVLAECSVIQTEVTFVEMYRGQPMFGDVDRFLREAGFQFHTFLGFGGRSFSPFVNPDNPDGSFRQYLWADALYVRNWEHYEAISARKLVKQAVLLNDLFESYDLAYQSLLAADRKTGGTLAADYARWLAE